MAQAAPTPVEVPSALDIAKMSDREILESMLACVLDISERLATVEGTLERYKPLLAMAEARMNGPKMFGRGAARARQE